MHVSGSVPTRPAARAAAGLALALCAAAGVRLAGAQDLAGRPSSAQVDSSRYTGDTFDFTQGAPLQGPVLPGAWQLYANGDDILAIAREGATLWAGTRHGGLVRWNAAEETYTQFLRPQDPLADNTIRDIAIDSLGRKWLATPRGLTVFDDKGTLQRTDDRWHTYTSANSFGGLPSDDVWAVAPRGGEVWVGAHQIKNETTGAWSGGGLGRVRAGAVAGDADDNWAAVQTFESTRNSLPDGSEQLGLVSDNPTTLAFTPEGRLWIGTQPHRILDDENSVWPAVHGGLSALDTLGTEDAFDDTWAAFSCEDRPLTVSCYVLDLAIDEDGWMWAGTRGRGMLYFDASGNFLGSDADQRFTTADGLPDNDVRAVAFGPAGSDKVLAGTKAGFAVLAHNGTLRNRNDDQVDVITAADGLASDSVQALAVDSAGVWLGTGAERGVGGGINQVVLTSLDVEAHLATSAAFGGSAPVSNFVRDLDFGAVGSRWEDHVWIAFGSDEQRLFGAGAAHFDTQGTDSSADDTWQVFTAAGTDADGRSPWTGLSGNNVHDVLVDGDLVWIGSTSSVWNATTRAYEDGGLSVYDGTRWTARAVTTGGLRQANVGTLARGCDGRIWAGLGTAWEAGVGIDVLKATAPHTPAGDVWEAVRFPDLPSDQVTKVSVDCTQPRVWVSGIDQFRAGRFSDGGASRYEPGTDKWTTYDTTNGLVSYNSGGVKAEGTTVLAGPGGRAWVGTYGTDATTDGALIQTRPYWPAVVNSFDGASWESQVFQGAGWVSSMAVDQDGQLWAGLSRGGAARDSIEAENWAEDRTVPGLALKGEGGWQIVDPQVTGALGNDVSTLAVDPAGNVWIGTEGWGFAVYLPNAVPPTPTATSGAASPTPTATRSATPVRTATITPTGTRPTPTPTRRVTAGTRDQFVYLPAIFQAKHQ